MKLVFKRCLSALPANECPVIPKSYLRRFPRSLELIETHLNRTKRLTPVDEPEVRCEKRRLLGDEIINEKMANVHNYFARFMGNLFAHFINGTYAQQVEM